MKSKREDKQLQRKERPSRETEKNTETASDGRTGRMRNELFRFHSSRFMLYILFSSFVDQFLCVRERI